MTSADSPDRRPANRLLGEKSPYLLQHAYNPVDWYPWGTEAFERARAENRPVFLSIGYSTCHWCHVMERESFEDEEVAQILNSHFVSVKVDREERPDVDQVYMQACHALNGSGGWPLTLLLTPGAEPFFAATYLPKNTGAGRLGLVALLRQAAELWSRDPEHIAASAGKLVEALKLSSQKTSGTGSAVLPSDIHAKAVATLAREFDPEFGGFERAPKFPAPHRLTYLLRRYRRTGETLPLRMACRTLDALRAGGIWDHLGFGFHRYSTDQRWFAPHFEKMLYDQAGLALAYLEAFQVTGNAVYARTARQTLEYVCRDLSDPKGGLYCGEDADSEGEEGRFYTWERAEIFSLLGPDERKRFASFYGVTGEGNCRDEATGKAAGRNILFMKLPPEEGGPPPFDAEDALAAARAVLLAARGKRVRPHRDDKVLTSWTAFASSALAKVGGVLGEEAFVRRAGEALSFLLGEMTQDGKLHRRYRDGEVSIGGFAEDFSYLGRACLDLYSINFKPELLGAGEKLAEDLWLRFRSEDGGLHDTASDAEPLIFRPGDATDGAMPSAASIALELFARLHWLTEEEKWAERANSLIRSQARQAAAFPTAFTHFLSGAALMGEPVRTVHLSGDASDAEIRKFLDVAAKTFAPETAIRFTDAPAEPPRLRVCDNVACREPPRDPEEFKTLLSSPP